MDIYRWLDLLNTLFRMRSLNALEKYLNDYINDPMHGTHGTPYRNKLVVFRYALDKHWDSDELHVLITQELALTYSALHQDIAAHIGKRKSGEKQGYWLPTNSQFPVPTVAEGPDGK